MAGRVVLLHGLWNPRAVLWPLAARLRAVGFAPEAFAYSSAFEGAEAAAGRLADRLRQQTRQGRPPPHLVGHSLGGLVALIAAHEPGLPLQRIVCLGSPLSGSRAADTLGRHGLAVLLGRSARVLRRGLEGLPAGREVGVVAGTLGLGLGRALSRFEGRHDGTVAVAETRLPGLAGHCEVHASHMGLLVSRAAAEAVASFLRTGRFAG
ncbi:esterase/lipase family protein [Silanimonas lenta]|uniref:esterase/lipase family protein n=1 Tax=Silanimonas lenta TaxID=265429 RepID=UPI00048ACF21|nr:alpha/beta fold hydrolase [Silanimonas lenta]